MSKELNQHLEQAEGAQGERERFEVEMLELCLPIERDSHGAYVSDHVRHLWSGWELRAALAQPSMVPELGVPLDATHYLPGAPENRKYRREIDGVWHEFCGKRWLPLDHGTPETYLPVHSPAPELERPEVVEAAVLELEAAGWRNDDPQASVSSVSTMLSRIVGALQAELASTTDASNRYNNLWNSAGNRLALAQVEIRKLTSERDAAQAKLAELEKQEPVYTKPSWADNYGWSGGYIDFKCATDVERLARHFEDLLDAVPEGPLYAAPVAQAGQVPEQCGPGIYAIHYLDNWDGQGDRNYLISEKTADGRWLCHENGSELLQYKGDAILSAWLLAATTDQGGAQ